MINQNFKYNIKLIKFSPFLFIGIGVAITFFSISFEKNFNPFILLAFILIGVFEIFFGKQTRINSNILSFIAGLIVILILKLYIIDFKIMKRDALESGIKEAALIFYQPSMFKLHVNDIVIYVPSGEKKYYIASIKNINKNKYEIYPPSKKNPEGITRDQIKGKIIGK